MLETVDLLLILVFAISLIVVAAGLFQHNSILVKRWLIVGATAFIIFIFILLTPYLLNNCDCHLDSCCSSGCNCSCAKPGPKLWP